MRGSRIRAGARLGSGWTLGWLGALALASASPAWGDEPSEREKPARATRAEQPSWSSASAAEGLPASVAEELPASAEAVRDSAGDLGARVRIGAEDEATGLVFTLMHDSRPTRAGDDVALAIRSPEQISEPWGERTLRLWGGVEHRLSEPLSLSLEGGARSESPLARPEPEGRVGLKLEF